MRACHLCLFAIFMYTKSHLISCRLNVRKKLTKNRRTRNTYRSRNCNDCLLLSIIITVMNIAWQLWQVDDYLVFKSYHVVAGNSSIFYQSSFATLYCRTDNIGRQQAILCIVYLLLKLLDHMCPVNNFFKV